MIDLHAHILPGIDDGASDISKSVELLRELASVGVTDVFATPHYVDETIYVSPFSDNLRLLTEVQAASDAAGLNVRVHLGNEIYITPRILELLKSGEISSLDGSSYVLVELPMSGDFPGYEDIFLALIRAGYHVVLAHPERYTSFQDDFSLISNLSEMGVLFQSNVGSFAGQYGKTVFKLVRRLAKERMIFAMGSDIHHVHPGLLADGLKKLSKFYKGAELNEILVGNPSRIIINNIK